MSNILICPSCQSICNWNYYFQAYVCENCGERIITPEPANTMVSNPSGGYVVIDKTNDPIPGVVTVPSVQILPNQTNGDRIRGMTDEKMAELIDKTGCGLCGLLGIRDLCRASKNKSCYEIIMAWLNQPAKGV